MNLCNKVLLTGVLAVSLAACNKPAEQTNSTTAQSTTNAETVNAKAANTETVNAEEANIDTATNTAKVLTVQHAYVKPSIPGQKVSAAYFSLKNNGSEPVEVTEIRSDVAKMTEFHTMKMEGSKMVMRKMPEVKIPADGVLLLSQGADHVMLMQLHKPLTAGDKVNFTLTLANGKTFDIQAPVQGEVLSPKHEESPDHHQHTDDTHHHE